MKKMIKIWKMNEKMGLLIIFNIYLYRGDIFLGRDYWLGRCQTLIIFKVHRRMFLA